MLDFSVKIGLIPMRRDCTPRPGTFNWEFAEARGQEIVRYIEEHYAEENVSFVDLKGINPVETLFSENDVDAVVSHMLHSNVDAIVIINSNFGNEEVAAMVARRLNLPVLLWAPLDDVIDPDGMRYTDSQCGLFGVSRQMQRFHIPFSFVKSCRVEDAAFAEGLHSFASVACMVKNFRGMRIAEVGMRPKPFCSVIFNEGELMERFGMQVVPVNMTNVANLFNAILAQRDAELEEGAKLLEKRYMLDEMTKPVLKKMYAFVLLYRQIMEQYRVDTISSECWTAMQAAVGAMPCTAFGILADMGLPVSCESDVHGAITMALLACASLGKKAPFFGEFTIRHPQAQNTELLWHCGPFPYSTKDPNCKATQLNMRQCFEVKAGTYTVARFDQDDGHYQLLSGVCRSGSGPYTTGTYLWAEFDDLDLWERKIMEGPYIHHMAEIEGDYRRELQEFCKYIPGLKADPVV